MTQLFAPVLVLHVALALALLLPAVLVPLLGERELALTRGLAAVQARGTGPIGLGLLVTGLGLVAIVGLDLLGQSWLVLGIALYVVTLVVAFASRGRLGRQVRWVSYLIAGLVGVIGFLMATKPALW